MNDYAVNLGFIPGVPFLGPMEYLRGGFAGSAGDLPTVDVPLLPGSRSVIVQRLQEILASRGYVADPPDGIMTSRTLDGIQRAFQDLARSPSARSRALTGSGPQALVTADLVARALAEAFVDHESLTVADRIAAGASKVRIKSPTAPAQIIVMGPREAVAFGRSAGFEGVDSQDKPAPGSMIGTIAVVIGTIAVWILARRRS